MRNLWLRARRPRALDAYKSADLAPTRPSLRLRDCGALTQGRIGGECVDESEASEFAGIGRPEKDEEGDGRDSEQTIRKWIYTFIMAMQMVHQRQVGSQQRRA